MRSESKPESCWAYIAKKHTCKVLLHPAFFHQGRVQASRGQERTAPSSHCALARMREMLLRVATCEARGPNFFGHVDRKHTHLRKRSAAAVRRSLARWKSEGGDLAIARVICHTNKERRRRRSSADKRRFFKASFQGTKFGAEQRRRHHFCQIVIA